MTALTFSAQCDEVCYRLSNIRDEVGESVKEQARQMVQTSQAVSRLDVAPLLTQGFKEFSARALKEYENTPFLDVVKLLIPSHRFFFFSRNLWTDVCQIFKVDLPGSHKKL
jgi:hypothetical protein